MLQNMDTFMKKILEYLESPDYISSDDIPNIELYMDQVTTFMDHHLASLKRNEEDKILTKTMINNYAKNDLLPPPVKKKYSRNHILMMIFIYYFKGFLSISDIQSMLNPLAENHFDKASPIPLKDVYEQIFALKKEQSRILCEDVSSKYETARTLFADADDKEFLQCFSMICMLSFDVYQKKQMIEKMIDTFLSRPDTETQEAAKKAEAKAAKKAAKAQKAQNSSSNA